MKSIKILVCALAVLALGACKQKGPDGPVEPEKSNACKLTGMTVSTGTNERNCTIYEKNKEVEVLEILGFDLSNVYLRPSVSAGATTNIDSSKPYNLLKSPVSIVVTAEDGVTTATYNIVTRPGQVAFDVSPIWNKTAGSIGYTKTAATGGSVAFVGTDRFVTYGGSVRNLADGSEAGTLCTTGIEEGAVMYNLANDVNGVVIANYVVGENIFDSGSEVVFYGFTYAWVNGWDKAPVELYSNKKAYIENPENGGNAFGYMSCGGDVKGDFLLTMITAGRGATTTHHLFEFHNGDYANPKWYPFTTDLVSNDGNWGQMVSPTSGNIKGWFVIGDSMGYNKGYHVYTRRGVENKFEDYELWGTTWPDGLIPDGYGDDPDQRFYGNYSTGHVRGFQFKGVDYLIATTTGWPCTYLTIQSMYQEGEGEEAEANHYLLRTQQLDGAMVIPSSAYIYDAMHERGLVLTNTNTNFYLYEIVGDFI